MKEQIKGILDNETIREAKIEKIVSISFDGDQYVVRIPKKFSDALEIKKGNKMKFNTNLEYNEKVKKKLLVVEIIG